MNIRQIKKEMKNWIDFYGGDFIVFDEIDKAKTGDELRNIFDRHEKRFEDMLSDACSHLREFKNKVLG
jgi:hypothetical protein